MQITENKINPGNVAHDNTELHVAQYDPSKSYRWEPDSVFVLNGEEYGIILNALRLVLNTPEAVRILRIEKASQVIENSLAKAVQAGVAKETTK